MKQFVSYGLVCCQKHDSYFTSVLPEVIPLQSFGMCGYTKKAFTCCKLNLNPSTSFFKIESYLLPNDDQLSLYTHLAAQSEVVHRTCAKAVECFFRDMLSCFNFSLVL